ncbi:MAG: helix-turn-helix domain-containing protein [[Clostridium] scindens]|uniref:helix-turn-helix domain-containing protein n=1 Tax=Clostridium scindens (strain JCM 10418 / VPI 12708) TaxID=29347 RepID=UPI0039933876
MIYDRIKNLCKKRGISIYRLEKDLEFSRCCISKWKMSSPSVEKLQKVANYFDVPIKYFLEEDKE